MKYIWGESSIWCPDFSNFDSSSPSLSPLEFCQPSIFSPNPVIFLFHWVFHPNPVFYPWCVSPIQPLHSDKLCSVFTAFPLSPIVLFWQSMRWVWIVSRIFSPGDLCAVFAVFWLSLGILSLPRASAQGKINLSRFCRKIPSHHFHCAQFSPSRPVCLRQGVEKRTSDVSLTWTLTASSGTDCSRLIAFSSVKICPHRRTSPVYTLANMCVCIPFINVSCYVL